MSIVHGNTILEVVAAARAHPENGGEDNGVAHRPGMIFLRVAFHQPAFDNTELEAVKTDLLVPTQELLLLGTALSLEHIVHVIAVEPLHVVGVQGVLHGLKPVAR